MAKKQTERAALDTLDLRILAALSEDAEMPNKALAAQLGQAESTCAYRIRAMREAGVIRGRRLVVDPATLGYPLQAVIKVRLGSHSHEHVTKLYDDLTRTPGVLQAFHVAGADDFHLHVAVADAEALRDLVLRHVTVHRVVRGTETHLVFEHRTGIGILPGPTR